MTKELASPFDARSLGSPVALCDTESPDCDDCLNATFEAGCKVFCESHDESPVAGERAGLLPRPQLVRYATVVADPPWDQKRGVAYSDGLAKSGKNYRRESNRSRPMQYPTMTVDQIAALPVDALADVNSHLYLWVTNKYIESGYDVARAWGFRPVVLLTWAKTPKGIGLGGTYVQTTEHIIFARRGKLSAIRRVDSTWWNWKRQDAAHSKKPEAFQDLVETVSPGPYVELFARRRRAGWAVWGNEVESDLNLGGGVAESNAPVAPDEFPESRPGAPTEAAA